MSVSHVTDPLVGKYLNALLDRVQYQILQHTDGTLLVNQRLLQKILDGDAFAAGWRVDGVASGSSTYFQFENPSGSGVYANIIMISITGTGNARINMYTYDQVTINTPGTAVTPLNLNPSTGKSAKCVLRYGGSYTLGTPRIEQVLPGGSKVRAVGASMFTDLNLRMPSDFYVLIEVVNQSGSSEDFSIKVIWWEE